MYIGDESPKINTLEDKSKNRRRLHYGRLAKSKDLSSRSSTDIDLILGRHKRREMKEKAQQSNSDSSNDETRANQKLDKQDYSGKPVRYIFTKFIKKCKFIRVINC